MAWVFMLLRTALSNCRRVSEGDSARLRIRGSSVALSSRPLLVFHAVLRDGKIRDMDDALYCRYGWLTRLRYGGLG